MQIVEKNTVPRTTCFLVVSRDSFYILSLSGVVQKRCRKKIADVVRTTIFLENIAGTHDSGSRKIVPESCIPLFL